MLVKGATGSKETANLIWYWLVQWLLILCLGMYYEVKSWSSAKNTKFWARINCKVYVCCSDVECRCFLFANKIISVLFDHYDYDYYRSPWLSILNFGFRVSEQGNFGYAVTHLPGCFCPWTSFIIWDWTSYRRTLYAKFIFATRMFCRGVPGLNLIVLVVFGAVDELATWRLYFSPRFGN